MNHFLTWINAKLLPSVYFCMIILNEDRMQFDPNNPVVKLCALGMDLEGEGKPEAAYQLFRKAWNESSDDFERFIAAHYIARHQKSAADKLTWDKTALDLALKLNDHAMEANYPSLYLNVGKCYEDLNDFDQARENYQFALSFSDQLPNNGYGDMIRSGIRNGIKRVS
jgi:tetratricopeptide (TPR) repeat protein